MDAHPSLLIGDTRAYLVGCLVGWLVAQEERERKLKEAKIRKELLEACFDDEMEDVVKILSTEVWLS